ncbi:MAG TPA: pyridoxamine 5'-phosphate oxidase family protein, partial [Dehalococcoidia bacterium]|nr:pyridoxamine 5'-phosphate oxidase family protein [Dehalococcoidia bacterium]
MTDRREPIASRPHMPGYGIAEDTSGLLPWSWAEERLTACRNYWIITVNADGSPHAMPVWGVWQDGGFLFGTGERSRKARNIARDPRIVVATEGGDEPIVLHGVAVRVTESDTMAPFLEAYERKYDWGAGESSDDTNSDNDPMFL